MKWNNQQDSFGGGFRLHMGEFADGSLFLSMEHGDDTKSFAREGTTIKLFDRDQAAACRAHYHKLLALLQCDD